MRWQDEYPVLDDQPTSALLRRSTLYNLEPIGLGTGARESLTSYAERLADAHCISPRMLADVPAAGQIARVKFNRGAALRARWFVTGASTSLEWAQILGRLTGRLGLEALTLAPLAAVINDRNLTSRRRRWCPQCLREAATSHALYTQLLWDIDCVTACPFHDITLSAECSCKLTRDPRRRVKWSPGHCSCCGQLLCETLPTREAHLRQVRLARVVQALLADPRFDQGGWNASNDHSGTFLKSAAIRHFQGKSAQLARALGLSKSALHGWMKGNHRPALALLVGVADRTGCSVADILDGRADDTHLPGGRIVRPRRKTSLRVMRAQRETMTQQLASILCDPVPVALLHVARQLEVNCDYLRDRYPEQSAAIVSRFKAYQTGRIAAKKAAFSAALRTRAEQLVAQDVWPTSQRLLSGLEPPDRYAKLHAEVKYVLAETRRRMESARSTGLLHRTTGLHQIALEP
jgi:transcriptional regulator with XRE-family HTH domain